MGVDKPKQTKKKFTSFYESETLAESSKKDEQSAKPQAELNRRTHRPKPEHKDGELNRNTNYRTNWQDEE